MSAELLSRPTARRGAVTVASLLTALAVFGIGFGKPTLSSDITLTDLFLFGVIALLVLNAIAGQTLVADVARRLALPGGLILLGSLLAALNVGLAGWTVGDLIRDAAAAGTFLGVIDVLRREGARALRLASHALIGAALTVSVHLLLFDNGLRARATFPNPNVAGHFLASAAVGIQLLPVRPAVRRTASLVLLAALVRTSSFGALLQVAVGFLVLGSSRLRRMARERPDVAALAGVGLAVLGVAAVVLVPRLLPEQNASTALSSSRLDRSAAGRVSTWREGVALIDDYPFGIGAGSSRGLELLENEQELHNEPLAYLVERGVIGLAGLIALGVALWRLTSPGSGARALLAGYALSSLVRETSHYRHLWVILALALVADAHRRQPVDELDR